MRSLLGKTLVAAVATATALGAGIAVKAQTGAEPTAEQVTAALPAPVEDPRGPASAGSAPAPSTPTTAPVTTASTTAPGSSAQRGTAVRTGPVGSTGSGASCAVPATVPVPTTQHVVGNGTPASCSQAALRSAVSAGGHVTFKCGTGNATITVTRQITAKRTTVIDGGGKVTLRGGGGNRILLADNGTTLSVRNLRLVGGNAVKAETGPNGGGAVAGMFRTRLEVIGSTFEDNAAEVGGGAVMAGTDSSLTVVRSRFTGNSSAYGGALYSLLSPLTVVNSTFDDNHSDKNGAKGSGGAIGTDGAAPLSRDGKGGDIRICGSTFTRNTGDRAGGGMYLWAYGRDRILVDRSTFQSNRINGLGGGARISIGPSDFAKTGTITITGTSILSNTSGGNGGGLYLDCAPTCTINNSTLYGNTSKAYGGAIFGDGHHDNNVTFAKNKASGHGGALFGSKFVLTNTVFVGNSAGNPWGQAMTCSTTGTGKNVVQWLSSSKDTSTPCIPDVTAKNPKLADPAANGGPTRTMMPAANSPILTIGSGCTSRDQRGVARKPNACDLGAVQRS
ncbi:MAG: choice-of-anchor Q domain-containing protein [Kineosporiaceae bacterium]